MKTNGQHRATVTVLSGLVASCLVGVLWLGFASSGTAQIRLPGSVSLAGSSNGTTGAPGTNPHVAGTSHAAGLVLGSPDVIEISPEREVEIFEPGSLFKPGHTSAAHASATKGGSSQLGSGTNALPSSVTISGDVSSSDAPSGSPPSTEAG